MLIRYPVLAAALVICGGCLYVRPASGGGTKEHFPENRRIDPGDIALPDGYRAEAVTTGLTFPSAVAFDDKGTPYVLEAGYSYGEVFTVPRILRVEAGGKTTEIARGEHPPWNGFVFHDGAFYVAEGGEQGGGRILKVALDGKQTPLVENLPSYGDHHTNGPAIGPDGQLYFGQGTATNSGVVGPDDFQFGWVPRHPDFHDTPCEDLVLAGENFRSKDPRGSGEVVTGAFSPYGTATTSGQVVKGALPCNGAVMKIPLAGGKPELVAWGFRNPFGLAFSPDGKLYVTDNGYDERGSRPIYGAADLLWEVKPGSWYGWPDYAEGTPVFEDDRFQPIEHERPKALLAKAPGKPPGPLAHFAVHSSSNGFDFSRNKAFGHVGEPFVAQFGDMSPKTGKVLNPIGFQVVTVDLSNGVITPFAANRKKLGPASGQDAGGLERPIAVRFDPPGTALYVVDFGVMVLSHKGPQPQRETGVLWKITRVP